MNKNQLLKNYLKLVLYDNRTSSKSYKSIQEVFLGELNYSLVTIPTGIIMGYPIAVWLLQTFTYEIYYVPTYFPSGLPIVMIVCVIILSVSATIPL